MTIPTAEKIAELSFSELDQVERLVADRKHELRTTGLETLRAQFETQAAAMGLALSDIIAAPKKRKRRRRSNGADPAVAEGATGHDTTAA